MKKYAVAFSVTAMLALTGCSAGTNEAATGSESSTPIARYDSVNDLRDAFVNAGGECPSYEQGNGVKYSAESATCSDSTVLSTYLSSETVQKRVDESKTALQGMDSSTWLVGENWIINAPNPEGLQEKMGGQLISWGDTTELDVYENQFKKWLLDDPASFASYDFRPALAIGHKVCEIYDTGDHQDVLNYLSPLAGEDFNSEQLGAILGISVGTLCPEHGDELPDS